MKAVASSRAVRASRKRAARQGEYRLPPGPDERCIAVVFLAAVGAPQQCRFRRRKDGLCDRHGRERVFPSS